MLKILLSAIPIAITGLLFEERIEALFGGNLIVVGLALLATAFLLLLTHYVRKEGSSVSYKQALIIGLAQAAAIIPGLSRSGATIATALLIGVERQKLPAFLSYGADSNFRGCFFKIAGLPRKPGPGTGSIRYFAGGSFVSAFLAGLLACNWMIQIVNRGKLTYFALYCFIVGLLAIGNYYLFS